MRIRWIMLLPLVLAPWAAAQTQTNKPAVSPLLAKLDKDYGFRDLKFEQSIDSCPGMTLLEEDPQLPIKFYARKSDELQLGGAKLKSIEYEFYKGKLSSIAIVSEGEPNGTALLNAFAQDYGPARPSPQNSNKHYWFADSVTVSCLMLSAGQADLRLWSKPMQNLRATDSKAKN